MHDYGKASELLCRQGKPWNTAHPKKPIAKRLAEETPTAEEGWHGSGALKVSAWHDAMALLDFEYQGNYGLGSASADQEHIWLLVNPCYADILGVNIQVTGYSMFTVGLYVDSPEDVFDGHYEKVGGLFNTPVQAAAFGLELMRKRLSKALDQLVDPSTL